ncbi:MAG: hypothetical protein A4E28_02207 [Methanocella sp. PtaU1.Bin125]|nr:MAG: hypothetical protein A4E28_02207 [Methanocella sp. PtaU1.Bin125]
MGRKLVNAVVVITVMVAIIGLMAVMATGCGVLDDFGNFGGEDNGGSGTPSKKPNFGGDDDDDDGTPTKKPGPTIQPYNPSKKGA